MKKVIKKKILIFANKDIYFTSKIVNYIIKEFPDYCFDVHFSEQNLTRKLKIILCLFLTSSIKKIAISFFNKKKFNNQLIEVNNIENLEDQYTFALSINYPKKINISIATYNFHLGNLSDQRGSFIFFYKFIYDWKKIDLSFHKIDQYFDKGFLLNKKTLNVENLDGIDILNLYPRNLLFVKECILKVLSKRKLKQAKSQSLKINTQPSFNKILKSISYLFFRS